MECDPIRETENVQSRRQRLLSPLLTLLLPPLLLLFHTFYSHPAAPSARVILFWFFLSASPSSHLLFSLFLRCEILPNFIFLFISHRSSWQYKRFNKNWCLINDLIETGIFLIEIFILIKYDEFLFLVETLLYATWERAVLAPTIQPVAIFAISLLSGHG